MSKLSKVFILSTALLVIVYISSCQRPTLPPGENIEPNTTLANIPVEDDTLFALATLHWDGEDDDGFITGYEYRYTTHHISAGDSVVQAWEETEATSLTIAFESSDSLNYQVFEVRAVDDMEGIDPTPATRTFYTRQTILPVTKILSPVPEQKLFVTDDITDWWMGVHLIMTASDADGEVVEYAWAVDDGDWNWTLDTALYITPDYFSPLEGEHTLRVISRDNTNLIDDTGDQVTINLITPTFDKGILIIDETIESKFPVGLNFSDAQVDTFYTQLFEPDTSWDFQKSGMPPKQLLGQYSLVIWHADDLPSFSSVEDNHQLSRHIHDIMDYLNVGGDFIMSGWRI
ncbi:MAG: hypothetical protein KAU50_03325, partial [Candidatus Marinimicrobia bacterium]|nr:hypothetical protein [Candidatus Neomarinimicrobiota bacterium]